MTPYTIHEQNVLKWAREYDGPKFHAMLCDPPYHLTSTTERFGKEDRAPAQYGTDGAFQRASKGFMGQEWDGGDIAFRPETWAAIGQHLYPGAFCFAFAASRGWHRMAVAIEDAGFILHPSLWVYWAQGQGFPKATRIKDIEEFSGHRYGLQAIKPSVEPVLCFQKPYENRPVDDITETGAGALNIDGGRIEASGEFVQAQTGHKGQPFGKRDHSFTSREYQTKGRWPANLILSHAPGCKREGAREIRGYQGIRGGLPDGHGIYGRSFPRGNRQEVGYTDADGRETIDNWQCVEGCPVRRLGEMSGDLKSGQPTGQRKATSGFSSGITPGAYDLTGFGDSGTAARFFKQTHYAYEIAERLADNDPVFYTSKASTKERNAGLEDRNIHPTLKTISLTKYLATLLLPPVAYVPRRILIPFAGAASEMIGALLAGWDEITGIEMMPEYTEIARARLKWWAQWPEWGQDHVDAILGSDGPADDGWQQLGLFEEQAMTIETTKCPQCSRVASLAFASPEYVVDEESEGAGEMVYPETQIGVYYCVSCRVLVDIWVEYPEIDE